MRAWFAILLAPLLAPAALAQEPLTLTADAPAKPLAPGAEPVALAVRVEVPCEALSTGNGSVELSIARRPAWATARVEPERLDPPMGAPCAMAWSGEAKLFVAARADAPALTEDVVGLVARMGDVTRSTGVPVRAAYVPNVLVEANDSPRAARPQEAVGFEVKVTNRGNGPTKVIVEAAATPPFQAVQPSSIVLASPLESPQRHSATFTIVVMTPYHTGKVDEEGVVTARLVPAYALDPSLAGPAQTLTFRVHAQGMYVPLPGAALAAFALAILALARRR